MSLPTLPLFCSQSYLFAYIIDAGQGKHLFIGAIRLSCELEGQTKTHVVVAVRWRVVVAIGHAAVPRVVVPATATIHTVRALWCLTYNCEITFL